jgi:RES domain-containing protein
VPSPELVAAVDELDPTTYSGVAYRHQAARWNPLSGAGARSQGGRWNPPQSFSTLYLATEPETAVAEFHRMAERAGRAPQDFLPRRLYRYEVNLVGLVDLRPEEARAVVALSDTDLAADTPSACQAIGEATQYLGRAGIVAPSATGQGTVIAVFFDRLGPNSSVQAIDYEIWTAAPRQ